MRSFFYHCTHSSIFNIQPSVYVILIWFSMLLHMINSHHIQVSEKAHWLFKILIKLSYKSLTTTRFFVIHFPNSATIFDKNYWIGTWIDSWNNEDFLFVWPSNECVFMQVLVYLIMKPNGRRWPVSFWLYWHYQIKFTMAAMHQNHTTTVKTWWNLWIQYYETITKNVRLEHNNWLEVHVVYRYLWETLFRLSILNSMFAYIRPTTGTKTILKWLMYNDKRWYFLQNTWLVFSRSPHVIYSTFYWIIKNCCFFNCW